MIRVVLDNKTIEVATVAELGSHVAEMFKADPNPDVMVTYVLTTQPTSRRMAPGTTEPELEP